MRSVKMFAQGNEAPSLLMLSMSAEPDVWGGGGIYHLHNFSHIFFFGLA